MIGFAFFVLVVVAGVLALVGGLRRLGVVEPREPAVRDGPGREDLLRLEEALAALDGRLDRLEDQQRFLERLLEARPEAPALPRSPAAEASAPESRGAADSILFDVEPGDG